MKIINCKFCIQIIIALFMFAGINANGFQFSEHMSVLENNNDTILIEFSGTVRDNSSRAPVIFASVLISGTNIGTVTNTEGEFLLKVPENLKSRQLEVSTLGYKTLTTPFSELKNTGNEIFLEPQAYPLEEVEIRKLDPVIILREALRKIPENYRPDPNMLTAFYRETIRKNRNFTGVSEAVFEVYKSGYGKIFDTDRIRIFKARKSQDVTRMDTLLFKLQGGPYNIFMLDIVRHPGDILSGDVLGYYNYTMLGTANIHDRNAYMISFEQKKEVPFPLYKGYLYIDIETKAFVAAEFSISEIAIDKAADYLVIKKPANVNVDVIDTEYRVNYRIADDRWVLNYARSEAHFRIGWPRRLFRSNYYAMSEMAVTDINPDNPVRYRIRETTRPRDILSDQISYFSDPEFWGDYNIIVPEQTIEEAIERLNRKLQR